MNSSAPTPATSGKFAATFDVAGDETLDLEGAAHFLRLGINATRALFDAGELPGVSLNQKHTVFLRSDLAAYIRAKAQEQAAARRRGLQPATTSPATQVRAKRGRTRRPPPRLPDSP